MRLHVEIIDDNGDILSEHDADACQPSVWNAPSGKRFIGSMPSNASDVRNNGTYELFRITFQPITRVDRPNGWQEPASPDNGQNGLKIPASMYPANFPLPKSSLWGKPSPSQPNSNMTKAFAPTRG